MARSRSIGGIYAELSLKDIKFRKALKGAERRLNDFVGTAARIGARAAGAAAVAAGAGIAATITKSIMAAADMEQLETAFVPLLGSADAAERRLDELSKFAASTPFELPEIAKASKILETLTRGALSTGEGLEMVGDLASAANRPFDEVAVTVGRLYDGLQSGRPVGEAMARLQELGAISGDTRGELERLQAEGRKGNEVWRVAERALGRFSGSMELQSQTWNGRISTLKDNINLAFAALGQPILDQLGPYLDNLAARDLTAIGKNLGDSLAEGIQVITDGSAWELFSLHAQMAFTKLQTQGLGLFNAWAAGINALWEWSLDDSMTFGEQFDRFLDAGNNENREIIEALQRQIDEIWDTAKENRENQGSTITGPDVPTPSPAEPQIIPAIELPDDVEVKMPEDVWQKSSIEVNEMQRRGLGFGAFYKDKEGEQVSLLQHIRDILQEAADNGGNLSWT